MQNSNSAPALLKFLNSQRILTIATSAENTPYVANVFYCADEKGNLYFLSSGKTRHAQELTRNPQVSIAIYDPSSSPGGIVAGVQAEGKVVVAKGTELAKNFANYLKLFPATRATLKLIKQLSSDTRLYKFSPTSYLYTDKRLFEKREEIKL